MEMKQCLFEHIYTAFNCLHVHVYFMYSVHLSLTMHVFALKNIPTLLTCISGYSEVCVFEIHVQGYQLFVKLFLNI